jgi:hypothetical protein
VVNIFRFPRRKVYNLVKSIDIELPRYAILDRETGNPDDARLEEAEDFIVVNGIGEFSSIHENYRREREELN